MWWRDLSTDADLVGGPPTALAGKRILVVEDSPVVAPFTAELLGELGGVVLGPAPNMASARELIENEAFDAALMDVHIRGERVFALCDLVAERNIPFIFTSGYADWEIPDEWTDRPRLQKPYTMDQVRETIEAVLAADRRG